MRKLIGILSIITLIIISSALYFRFVADKRVLSVSDKKVSFFEKLLPPSDYDIKKKMFLEVVERTKQHPGTYGIYIKNVYNEEVYQFNKDELYYGASLFKIPIAVAAIKEVQDGNRTFEDTISYRADDASAGTGIINQLPIGSVLRWDYVIDRLLKDSDNTAQSMLSRTLTQEQLIKAYDVMGIKNYFYVSNNLTPWQMGTYFDQLLKANYLNRSNVELLLNKMSQTSFDDRINAGLNEDVKFSHKIGNWGDTGTWHDCGVATKDEEKIIVCVMSRQTTFEDFLAVTKDVGEFVNILF